MISQTARMGRAATSRSRTASASGTWRLAGAAFGAMGNLFTLAVVSRKIGSMRIVFGLVALAACGDDGGGFPVGGGGNDGGFTSPDGQRADARLLDAAPDDAAVAPIDANQFMGRVCLLTDPRDLDLCATTGAGGLTVRLGTASTTTATDGRFTIDGQSGSNLVWRVTGSNIVSSYEVLADYQIPAMTNTMFMSMLVGSNVEQVPGEGSIMAYVSKNGMGASGLTADVTPEAFHSPYYDNPDSQGTWVQTSTGAHGAVWVPGLDVGSVTITVGGVSAEAPIFDGGITFTNILLP